MSFKNLFLFKGSSSIKSDEIEKCITLLILVGIIFVLILTLLGFALAELETDESPFVEINRITRVRETLSYRALLSGFPVGVFALILLFEFLRSHIGEKRFAERTLGVFALIRLFVFLRGHIGEKRFAERSIEAGFSFYSYLVFLTTARFGPSFAFVEAKNSEYSVCLSELLSQEKKNLCFRRYMLCVRS